MLFALCVLGDSTHQGRLDQIVSHVSIPRERHSITAHPGDLLFEKMGEVRHCIPFGCPRLPFDRNPPMYLVDVRRVWFSKMWLTNLFE